jgi:hypothetical protein
MFLKLDEDSFGSLYCPVCGMHVSKGRILAWERLSVVERQAECVRCQDPKFQARTNKNSPQDFLWAISKP